MDQSDKMIVIYTTFSSEEDARRIGRLIIEERVAACVNIFGGMRSIYHWQGQVEESDETAMIVKTRKSLKAEALELISANHPYSVPALIVLEPDHVAASYEAWLKEATHKNNAST